MTTTHAPRHEGIITVSTIAIVGAGPGMGLAIARTFGAKGFNVA